MREILAGCAIAIVLSAATATSEAATATLQRAWQFKEAQPAALRLQNFIGDLRIERGESAGFHVSVTVTAEADSDAGARSIAEAVEFRTSDAGASSSFEVVLPESRFPILYHRGAPQGWFGTRMYADYLGEKRRVTGDAAEGVRVRVDILVRAPAGARLDASNIFGESLAEGFAGELRLDGASGRLASRRGEGRVELDSGSGEVEVTTHSGEVSADTGSGPVVIRDCRCRISADTGSGSVTIEGGEGGIDVDTGSGGIAVKGFRGPVRADTGSGGVRATGLSGVSEFIADSGSGGVTASGDLSALRRLSIDTGSGRVILESSAWPAMELVLDAGSGGVQVDVPGAEVRLDEDRRSVVRTGQGGFRGHIDTGSGSISVRTTAATAN